MAPSRQPRPRYDTVAAEFTPLHIGDHCHRLRGARGTARIQCKRRGKTRCAPNLPADGATEPPPTSQRTFRGSCLGVPHVWCVSV